jgi:excisionase family DNA binding protein
MAGVDRAPLDSFATRLVPLEPLMSIDEVAGVLRISERGVYRLISRSELVALKVGQRTLIEPAELRAFIASQRKSTDPNHVERAA